MLWSSPRRHCLTSKNINTFQRQRPTSYSCLSYEHIPNLLNALIPAMHMEYPKMTSKSVFGVRLVPVC
ncbi:hypothetical protein Y032_0414g1038 [Ancylostoma ceylanicum]|uniref:Uncharacterized protein n=1 Tax=Ancylostoma ceylanicum TaxID=53326 RepID=A0A016X1U9_9BILA|nr:hypothetical protein Y032_0414g1038 [Ancylostoma ceylanicum]